MFKKTPIAWRVSLAGCMLLWLMSTSWSTQLVPSSRSCVGACADLTSALRLFWTLVMHSPGLQAVLCHGPQQAGTCCGASLTLLGPCPGARQPQPRGDLRNTVKNCDTFLGHAQHDGIDSTHVGPATCHDENFIHSEELHNAMDDVLKIPVHIQVGTLSMYIHSPM